MWCCRRSGGADRNGARPQVTTRVDDRGRSDSPVTTSVSAGFRWIEAESVRLLQAEPLESLARHAFTNRHLQFRGDTTDDDYRRLGALAGREPGCDRAREAGARPDGGHGSRPAPRSRNHRTPTPSSRPIRRGRSRCASPIACRFSSPTGAGASLPPCTPAGEGPVQASPEPRSRRSRSWAFRRPISSRRSARASARVTTRSTIASAPRFWA